MMQSKVSHVATACLLLEHVTGSRASQLQEPLPYLSCADAANSCAGVEPLPEAEEDLQEQEAQQQQHYAQQEQQQQQQHAPQHIQQQQQEAAKPGKRGLSAVGLQLAVGSQMQTGEWKSNGVWVKKDKQAQAVPSNLQVIPADDLVKVSRRLAGCGSGSRRAECSGHAAPATLCLTKAGNKLERLLLLICGSVTHVCADMAGQGAGAGLLW
jgi:hypothetical protein